MRAATEFASAAAEHGITRWSIRSCSFCGVPLNYLFNPDGSVEYQGGCGCRWDPPQPRTWDSVAQHYNMQSSPGVIAAYDEFWHFA